MAAGTPYGPAAAGPSEETIVCRQSAAPDHPGRFLIVRLIFRHGMVHLNHVLRQHGKRGEPACPELWKGVHMIGQMKAVLLLFGLAASVSSAAGVVTIPESKSSETSSKLDMYDVQDYLGFGFNVPGRGKWTNELGPDGYPNKILFEGRDTILLVEVRERDPESAAFTENWDETAVNLERLAGKNLGEELLSFEAFDGTEELPGNEEPEKRYGFRYACERQGEKLYVSVFYRFGENYTAEFVGIDTDETSGYRTAKEAAESFTELGGEAHMIGYRPPIMGEKLWDYPYLHNPFAVTLYYLDDIAPTKERQKTDYVIEWKDEGVETLVRAVIEKPEGAVMSSDLDHFTSLRLTLPPQDYDTYRIQVNEQDKWLPSGDITIHSIEDLLEFKNLVSLDLLLEDLEDISPISSMTGLKRLWLTADGEMEDLEWLRPLKNLELLDMWGIYPNIKDFGPMSGLAHLKSLRITVPSVRDVSPLAGLKELSYLDINTADLQNMDKLTQVEEMFLSAPDGYDLSVFAELPNLKVLYLYYSGELDTEPVVNAKQIEQLVINGEDIYDRTVSSPEEE